MVRHHLRHSPVHVAGTAEGNPLRRQAFVTHGLSQQQHLQLDIQRTLLLVLLVVEIRQRLRVTLGPRRLGTTEGLQRFGHHDPGRDAGGEALGQEWPQRLVLPGLQVARRPVVEQAEARHMAARLANRNRLAAGVAPADPDTQLQLVVEPLARTEARLAGTRRQGLAIGAPHRCAGHIDGRSATVIADGDVLVVRQQRIVRAEQLADVVGVMDADIEVGVVAYPGRQMHPTAIRRLQQRLAHALQLLAPLAVFRQQVLQRLAQRLARRCAQVEEDVEAAGAGGLRRLGGLSFEQPCLAGNAQVEDAVAHRDTAARLPTVATEDAQRQVGEGKLRMAVGRLDPTAQLCSCRHGLYGHVISRSCRRSWSGRSSSCRSHPAAAGFPVPGASGEAPGRFRT